MNKSMRAEGLWSGKVVSFSRTWGEHEFSEDEIATLLRGGNVAIIVDNDETHKIYCGYLSDECNYNGRKYTGFKLAWILRLRMGGHLFTREEVDTLVQGRKVFVPQFVDCYGDTFDAEIWIHSNKRVMISDVSKIPRKDNHA